jgi:hypothetical protein
MSVHRISLPLLLAAVTCGCTSFGPMVKRESELNCPTDIRRTVPWCAGEDAVFHCPCGPDGAFHGHRPTCWRSWPAPATVWRDTYCKGTLCSDDPSYVVEDPQVIMLPQPGETIHSVEPTPVPSMLPIPAEGSSAPGVIETQPPMLETPAIEVPAEPAAAIQRGTTVPARPAVLENPVGRVSPPPVLEPLPPTTQALPVSRSPQLAQRSEPVNCGVPMVPEPLAARPQLAPTTTAALPPRPPIVQAEALAPRPALRERTNSYARALPPRREATVSARPTVATTAPVAPRTDAIVAATPTGSAVTTRVAPAAHEHPASGQPASRNTTLAIVAEAPAAAAPTITASTVQRTPASSPTPQTAELNPNQGRSGWIFVR